MHIIGSGFVMLWFGHCPIHDHPMIINHNSITSDCFNIILLSTYYPFLGFGESGFK